jgi:hypothetical protein
VPLEPFEWQEEAEIVKKKGPRKMPAKPKEKSVSDASPAKPSRSSTVLPYVGGKCRHTKEYSAQPADGYCLMPSGTKCCQCGTWFHSANGRCWFTQSDCERSQEGGTCTRVE